MKIIKLKLKKILNRGISKIIQYSYEEAFSYVKESKAEIISFDVFDTLLKRNIDNPDQIFDFLEKIYNYKFNHNIRIKFLRKQGEIKARQYSDVEEISLKDIYAAIEGISDIDKEWLLNKEIELELDFCNRNKPIGEIYDWCIENKKTVIIVSDMYLQQSVIEKMLLKCGYSNWDKLYVSSRSQKLKSSGELFKYIIDENKYIPQKMLHIGDSLKGDFLMPKRMGLKAVLIPTSINNTKFENRVKNKSITDSILLNFINNNIERHSNWYEEFGYCVLGPLLYGYSNWLIQELEKKDINKVFFLTREGTLLEKSFDLIDKKKEITKTIISVSRKSTTVPLLTKLNSIEDFHEYFYTGREEYTLKQLLNACGLQKETIEALAMEKQLDLNGYIFSYINKEQIFNKIKNEVINYSKIQKKYIVKYLEDKDFTGKVAVADVGWHGTIQKNLQKLMSDVTIYGFYCGCLENNDKKNYYKGCYFDSKNDEIRNEIMFTASVFEMMFLSTDGSCIGYKLNCDGKICPVCAEPEQSEDNIKIITRIQEMALLFVQEFNSSRACLYMDNNYKSFYLPYHEIICRLNKEFIDKFKNFKFLNGETESLIPSKSTVYYFTHLKDLKSVFLNSSCKLICIKSILKIPLPYLKILSILKKYEKRKI